MYYVRRRRFHVGFYAADPPMVCHGICIPGKERKTPSSAHEENKEWVFKHLSDTWVPEANVSSGEVSSDINELEMAGLDTTLPCCDIVNVPACVVC